MTNEEAIRNIKMHIAEMMVSLQDTDEHLEAEQIAIEALEKQIPKKPEFTDDYYDVAVCPCCHQYEFERGTTTWQMAFCPNCSQAIDWSDDK